MNGVSKLHPWPRRVGGPFGAVLVWMLSSCGSEAPELAPESPTALQQMDIQAPSSVPQQRADASDWCGTYLEVGRHFFDQNLIIASQQNLEHALMCADDVRAREACELLVWVVANQAPSETYFYEEMNRLDCPVPDNLPFRWRESSESAPSLPAEGKVGTPSGAASE